MNKKGFTVVELIVSFTLAMTISVFLFQIVINLKNLYTNSTIKTELINIQSLVSREMNENFKKGIISVDECGDRCYEFFYIDDTSDKLILSDDSIKFGNYKSKLPKNSYIRNEAINISSSSTLSNSFDNSLLIIDIPIYNENFKEEVYNIKVVYPYNSNENDLNFGIEFTMEPVGFDYTGGEQVFTVPHSGYYKLEVWGAQGGYAASSTKGPGGYGGYSSGNIYLTKNTNLFVYVGGKGQDASSVNKEYTGGYNGGASSKSTTNVYNGAGGGATHIALEGGLLSTLSSKVSSILIVAGGGGGSASNGTDFILGASGGGYIGNNGMKPPNNDGAFGLGGTQTAGGSYTLYTRPQTPPTPGSFGQGGNPASLGGAGGGAGYYGGGGASIWGSAGAGSGYIGNTNLIDKNMYCYNCSTSNDQSTRTYSTTNVSETPTSQYAKIGNGYAKITYIGESLE